MTAQLSPIDASPLVETDSLYLEFVVSAKFGVDHIALVRCGSQVSPAIISGISVDMIDEGWFFSRHHLEHDPVDEIPSPIRADDEVSLLQVSRWLASTSTVESGYRSRRSWAALADQVARLRVILKQLLKSLSRRNGIWSHNGRLRYEHDLVNP